MAGAVSAVSLFDLPIVGPRFTLEAGDTDNRLAIRRQVDDTVVGAIELAQRDGTLHIQSLVVDPEHRGYGAGSEAARLLVDAMPASVERVTAWAPPEIGLAAYFWSRMGFRPVHGEGPDGGLLFERQLMVAEH